MTAAVELRNVHKRFGKTEIIRGTSLSVAPGERVAIIGPNGAGKSTLFNLISGRFGASSGDILLNGRKIDGLKPYEINRLGLARSFQVSNLFNNLSVFENLRCAVLWSLGYRYAFWKFLSNLRDAGHQHGPASDGFAVMLSVVEPQVEAPPVVDQGDQVGHDPAGAPA